MTFNDIFKQSFLEGYSPAALSPKAVVLCLCIACAVGVYIFLAHRVVCRKSFYNQSFGVALVCLPIITAAIILAVQSSVVISLGMVGALSIVRFRTAVKDPMDLVFLFWAISVGIICGAGLAAIAVILSLLLSVVVWLFQSIPAPRTPVLLLITSRNPEGEEALMETVRKSCTGVRVRSRTITDGQLDLAVEIRTTKEAQLAANLSALEDVTSATILAHDGETTFA